MVNYKNYSNQNKRKTLTVIVLVIIILIGAVTGFYFMFKKDVSDDINDSSDKEYTIQQYTDETSKFNSDAKNNDKLTNEQTTTIPDKTDESAKLSISDISSDENSVTITANAINIMPTRCSFTFTSSDSRPVVRDVPAQSQTCGPITVSYLDFDKPGSWTVSITAYNPGSRTTTQDTVEVK